MLAAAGDAAVTGGTDPKRAHNDALLRSQIQVRGVVQGVGFRPFVYRLAMEEGLAGSIGNDTDGVTIEIEGPAERVKAFLGRLRSETPPLARIDSVAVRELAPTVSHAGTPLGQAVFRIASSEVKGRVSTGIPADAATCPDCLRELLDPAGRRYLYPFLNCTNCGPRFTITRQIPYDRPQTSMAGFSMCGACQREYDNPANRRFHAQPNACWECGPRVWLVQVDGESLQGAALSGNIAEDAPEKDRPEEMLESRKSTDFSPPGKGADLKKSPSQAERISADLLRVSTFSAAFAAPHSPALPISRVQESLAAMEQAIELLQNGRIVAVKGIGGFHLGVDATNEEAVRRLRERKRRFGKPLAVMVRDLDAARQVCALTAAEEALLTAPARPIVLARQRDASGIAASVAPGLPWIGIFLPYAPLHHLFFAPNLVSGHSKKDRLRVLVMTSGNLSEEPIAMENEEARSRLAGIADAFLMHDREILQRCDDSVVAVVDGAPQLFRRARGFVPLAVEMPSMLQPNVSPLLAVGGHMKSVFTLARDGLAFQSQHLGDLENLASLEFFRESLDHLMRTFEIEPGCVAHDLHPGYLSTIWAREWAQERGLPRIAVQHHHAHVAGCMAEHGLEGEVIGLALDGTGYGSDGKIWGGEVLIARLDGFERFAHLDYVPMPGGEAAIREPWRMALAHLRAAGFDPVAGNPFEPMGATERDERVIRRMIERGVNSPLTSSLGRFFDAVAAVVLNRRTVDYEAQAAMELEGLAIDEPDNPEERNELGALMEMESNRPENWSKAGSVSQTRSAPLYRMELVSGNWAGREAVRISPAPLWRALVGDLRSGVSKARIAARFHAGVAEGFVRAAIQARAATGVGRVVLSGGCMHNRRLARLLRKGLEAEAFQVFQHRSVSPGDGGLSYGQAAVAAAILARRGGTHPVQRSVR